MQICFRLQGSRNSFWNNCKIFLSIFIFLRVIKIRFSNIDIFQCTYAWTPFYQSNIRQKKINSIILVFNFLVQRWPRQEESSRCWRKRNLSAGSKKLIVFRWPPEGWFLFSKSTKHEWSQQWRSIALCTFPLIDGVFRYKAEFGMDPPSMSQVKKWHDQFMSTGSIEPKDQVSLNQTFASVRDKLFVDKF